MGILARFGDIMRSNVNAILDKMEDPAKMVDQTLLDLRKDLADVKKETASIMADEKSAKRALDNNQAEIDKCAAAATNAVKAGNDGDACKILEKKQALEANMTSLQQNYQVAHVNAEKMRQMHDKLCADISSLEAKKDAIKGKVAIAKAQEKVNKMTASASSNASIAAFERMEAKADKMLDSAAAEADLNAGVNEDTDLINKYAQGSSATVEEELNAIKARLNSAPAAGN